MPDHGSMPLMPPGSGPVAVMVLLAIAALHTTHARAERGLVRWWHGAHVAMSAGMIVMFLLPHGPAAALFPVLAVAFGAHAAAMAVALPRAPVVGRWVWAAAILDGICMTYMLAPWRVVAVTAATVAYLVGAAICWALVRPGAVVTRAGPGAVATRAGPGAVVTRAGPVAVAPGVSPGAFAPSVRLTLTAMALIMAWMLLSMQLAQPSM